MSFALAAPPDVTPRVSSHPSYATTAGDDIIELAAHAGLVLDPWQQYVLRHGLGERPDGKWSAFELAIIVARQNGKGSIIEAIELGSLFLLDEQLTLHSAHEYRTAMEGFLRIRNLIDGCDALRRKVKRVVNTNGEEGIETLDGNRLRFVARSKGAGRGFSVDRLIWDEAYALTEEQVDAQMPTLSARLNPQIVYTSSPPLDPLTGAQLFRLRRRALGVDPGPLAFFDWGAAGCLDNLAGVDLDDRGLWAATNPAFGIRISEETIERERASMSDAGFARERLGVWPPDLGDGFSVIPAVAWAAAEDADSAIGGPLVFAPAVSIDRSRSSIAVAGVRADGLRHLEVVTSDAGTGWVAGRLAELVTRHRPAATVVDEFGPTGSLIPDLERAGVRVERIGTAAAAQAFGMFYDAICGDKPARVVRHIGQQELTAAVAGSARRKLGDGSAWDRRNAQVDITPLVAVTNALWGLTQFGSKKAVKPWVAYV